MPRVDGFSCGYLSALFQLLGLFFSRYFYMANNNHSIADIH
ncbi:Uncharacterized protein ChrSV_1493 [Chromobacterium vaccinii]|nr:Uncharacterized protein ChrSW_1493 [Chromobacterium vaccinii]QND88951.1 Uncharacterized protein ChrSV_1493 [Chromobacterium vaccinii]